MNGNLKPMSEGLTLHTSVKISALERREEGSTLQGAYAAEDVRFDHLIFAVPQPQTRRLLSPLPDVQAKMNKVGMQPFWTLIIGFRQPLSTEIVFTSYDEGLVHKVFRETKKPDRELPDDIWVVQASADWSTKHLEDDPQQVKAKLKKVFFAAIECRHAVPEINMFHCYRYA